MKRSIVIPSALLAFVAAVNFLCMPGEFLSGDPHAWREETRSLLLAGELNVPQQAVAALAGRGADPGQYFVRNERNGLFYSKFGIANSLLAVPPLWLERALGGDLSRPGSQPSLLIGNLWNLALAVALAALLYSLAAAYTSRAFTRVLYVIGALYCTSLWFYQRAQASEICQTLFFTALFVALLGFLRPLQERGPRGLDARAWRCLALAWLCAAALVFTRLSYGLLLPLIALLGAYCALKGRPWRATASSAGPLAAALLVPAVLIVLLLGIVNNAKFGSPWLTGYHQWNAEIVLPFGRLADGLWGYLFSPRFSIFLHFPLLLFALAGLRQFAGRHRLDGVVMLSIFGAFLLVYSKTPSWAGEWTYGPRYLLPMLPVVSLPFLAFADDALDRIGTWPARAWAAAALACLVYSGYLQVQVNRLPFWTYYNARQVLFMSSSLATLDYFLYRHTALIADDLLRHRHNLDDLPFMREARQVVKPEIFAEYRARLGAMIDRGNLYWALPPGERR